MNEGRIGSEPAITLRKRAVQAFQHFGYDRAVASFLLIFMIALRLWDPTPVEFLRLKLFDAYQALWPRQATVHPVSIVDIDEPSIAALGQWPWPRTRMAEIVRKLKDQGAVIIGFDIVFAEPDRLSPGLVAKDMPALDPQTLQKLEALPSNDDVLAGALRQTRAVLGQTALATPGGQSVVQQTGFATKGPNALPFIRKYPGLLSNVPVLEQAATGRGLFTISPEQDGIVRRVPMVLAADGKLVPSLTLDILRVLTSSSAILIKTDSNGILGLTLPGFELKTDPRGQIWIHYARHDPDRYISAHDVLTGAAPKAKIAGKIILIGTSAIGLLDNKTTPISRSMPGVEVHAQVLESILTKDVLYEPNAALAIELLLILAVGIAIIALAPLLGAILLLIYGAVIAILVITVSLWSYKHDGALIDASYPLGSSFVVYSAVAFMNYVKEQLGRRRIRSAFSQYLSPELVAELARTSQSLVLGGEKRIMSVMFSDVRGFTGIAESFKDDPHGLTSLMNRFLTPLTNAIIEHKGTIDKYMGDAIMAFWNAPLKDINQERNACKAALDMVARLDALNAERSAEEQAPGRSRGPLRIGIGINTGVCIVGNMGSDLRFDYSVLGDTVNLASRIEGQSKTYGVTIILGDTTAAAVKASFALLEVDLLQVKGKTEPQPVWTLLGDSKTLASPAFQELAILHSDMIKAYRERRFDEALSLIEQCRPLGQGFSLDVLYDLYLERIGAFQVTPPPENWTGVFAAVSK